METGVPTTTSTSRCVICTACGATGLAAPSALPVAPTAKPAPSAPAAAPLRNTARLLRWVLLLGTSPCLIVCSFLGCGLRVRSSGFVLIGPRPRQLTPAQPTVTAPKTAATHSLAPLIPTVVAASHLLASDSTTTRLAPL